MDSSLVVVTGPAAEPVSIDTARAHCRVGGMFDDALLAGYLAAARAWAESYLGRALITQTLRWTVSERVDHRVWPAIPPGMLYSPNALGWPQGLHHPMELPRAPVQSVSSVVVRDIDDQDTTLTATQYSADLTLDPARLRLLPGSTVEPIRHVQVTFTAGYGADGSSVPAPICQAILMLTALLYEQRGDAGGEMPRVIEALLAPYRVTFFGG